MATNEQRAKLAQIPPRYIRLNPDDSQTPLWPDYDTSLDACEDTSGVDPRDAEIAALKQQLADVTRERDAWRDNAGVCAEAASKYQEDEDALRVQLAAAQASEALLRGALDELKAYAGEMRREGGFGSRLGNDAAAIQRICDNAALATPPSDAVKRIMAMEWVCEAADKLFRAPVYIGREHCFGTHTGHELGFAPREDIANYNEACAALRALTTTKEHGDAEKTR